MAWTVPDKGEGANDIQSILFQEDLEALVDGLQGNNFVLSGCAVTAQGTPDMTVAVAKGAVMSNNTLRAVTAGNVTVTAANATNPRIDLIVVDSSGVKQCRAGTAAAAPKPPARSANDVILAQVYVPANDTTIGSTQIVDKRVFRNGHPIIIYKNTSIYTVNNNSGVVHMLNNAGSGLSLPNGLCQAGKTLRVRIGASFLLNSGTPSLTYVISIGGSSIWSDLTANATADVDRVGVWIEFDLKFHATNSFTLAGHIQHSLVGAKSAPSPGVTGDFVATHLNTPIISATGTTDMDSADRILVVSAQMSVANAANEMKIYSESIEIF